MLYLPDGSKIDNPTPEQFRDAILSRGANQAVRFTHANGRTLVYETAMFGTAVRYLDSPEQIRATRAASSPPVETVITLFQRFAADDPAWDRDVKMNLKERGAGCITTTGSAALVLATALFVWLKSRT
jgi:hypothetical protein